MIQKIIIGCFVGAILLGLAFFSSTRSPEITSGSLIEITGSPSGLSGGAIQITKSQHELLQGFEKTSVDDYGPFYKVLLTQIMENRNVGLDTSWHSVQFEPGSEVGKVTMPSGYVLIQFGSKDECIYMKSFYHDGHDVIALGDQDEFCSR